MEFQIWNSTTSFKNKKGLKNKTEQFDMFTSYLISSQKTIIIIMLVSHCHIENVMPLHKLNNRTSVWVEEKVSPSHYTFYSLQPYWLLSPNLSPNSKASLLQILLNFYVHHPLRKHNFLYKL